MATGTPQTREEHNAAGAPGGTHCHGTQADTDEHATAPQAEHIATGTQADTDERAAGGTHCHRHPGRYGTNMPLARRRYT